MHPSPRIMRGGAFALGMLLTLGVFFSLNQRWQGLSANISDAVSSTTDTPVVSPDLLSHLHENTLTITTARRFPAHAAQSFRADILYNPLVFTSSTQVSVVSDFLVSSTMDNGILSVLLAPDDKDAIAADTLLVDITFSPVEDERDRPLLESVSRYDPDQTESLHIMGQ